METTTTSVTVGSNPEEARSAASSDESPRIREYFDLRDALAEPGCPVCARVLRAGHEAIAALAAAPSPGAPARKNALAFRGLCNAHAWTVHRSAEQSVGLAQAYETFLRGRIETLQRAMVRQDSAAQPWSGWLHAVGDWVRGSLPGLRRFRRCPACRAAGAVERRDLGLLLDLIMDMEFARAFEASTGLCLPHLDLILRIAPDHPNLHRLLEAHLPKVKRLHADLQDFLRQAKAPLVTLTEAEHDAIWGRLFEWAAGKAGAFGHERDLASEAGAWAASSTRARRRTERKVSGLGVGEGDGRRMDEVERLSLENAKLQRRLVEVSREWAEESARRAGLQFQVHKLAEDVKVLELNLAGARGEAKAGDVQAARLREEIQALREEIQRLKGREGSPPGEAGR